MEATGNPKRYMSVKEAAKYIGLSEDFLNKDRSTKLHGVPFLRLGRRVLYDRVVLDAWLASQAENCAA